MRRLTNSAVSWNTAAKYNPAVPLPFFQKSAEDVLWRADRWAQERSARYGRLRAGLAGLLGAPRQQSVYERYQQATALTPARIQALQSSLARLEEPPLVSVVTPVFRPDRRLLAEAVASVRAQVYARWELILVDDGSEQAGLGELLGLFCQSDARIRALAREENGGISAATNTGIEAAQGAFVVFLDQDDLLAPDALAEVALAALPEVDFVYSDDDKIDMHGRRYAPQFKPDWSPDLLLSFCYVGHLKAFRRSLLLELGGMRRGFEGAQDYDLCLRAAEGGGRVRHVPKVLYHWRAAPGSTATRGDAKPDSLERGRRALEEALERRGLAGRVSRPEFAVSAGIGLYQVDLDVIDPPDVTIIIPFRDQADALRVCLESIEARTDYPRYRILLLDNGSQEDAMRRLLAETSHRVLPVDTGGAFNFSRLMNVGVAAAETDLVLLLNNDTEVLAADWLTRMVSHIIRPGVGAVGAKLLFPDRRTQHAGVVIGVDGLAAPAFKLAPHGVDHGAMSLADSLRNVSAVTAACLLTTREAFEAVGGFDAESLAVAYNDVDYCLKLRERGLKVVYDPGALLVHHENLTRGPGADRPDEEATFKARWRHVIDDDPYYNVNLSLADGHHRPLPAPRAPRAR